MKLTRHTDYAFRVLIYLSSRPDQVISVSELAKAYGISHNHLAKVAGELTSKGYTQVTRGRAGGLSLKREARTILLGEVVRDFEPTLDLVECFRPETNQCPIGPVCRLKGILGTAQSHFIKVLDSHSLADISLKSTDEDLADTRAVDINSMRMS
jgi:Rrf2 family nitric oxide-sensitive transcriptional repressor